MTVADIARGAFRPPNMRDKKRQEASWDEIAKQCGNEVGPHKNECLSCKQDATYWLEQNDARWSCEHCGEAGTAFRTGASRRSETTTRNRQVKPDAVASYYKEPFALPDELKVALITRSSISPPTGNKK